MYGKLEEREKDRERKNTEKKVGHVDLTPTRCPVFGRYEVRDSNRVILTHVLRGFA
jgi:hypothetical protein